MLCEECKQREAIIHITQVAGDVTAKHDYCEECGQKHLTPGGINLAELLQNPGGIENYLRGLLPKGTRFPVEAYEFVREGLGKAVTDAGVRHVSAGELLEVLRRLALARFGKSAKATLAGWEIRRTEDFGEIVFAMIDEGSLAKREEDRKEDFANGYDFDDAFPEN